MINVAMTIFTGAISGGAGGFGAQLALRRAIKLIQPHQARRLTRRHRRIKNSGTVLKRRDRRRLQQNALARCRAQHR